MSVSACHGKPLWCPRSNLGDWLVDNLVPRFGRLGVLPTDIMVLNFAVWINSAAELQRNVTVFSDFYEKYRTVLPFIIWRDASIQHFDTPTGARSPSWLPRLQANFGLSGRRL